MVENGSLAVVMWGEDFKPNSIPPEEGTTPPWKDAAAYGKLDIMLMLLLLLMMLLASPPLFERLTQ